MNTISTRTRRGAAILFSGVLVLGGITLAGEASAVKNVDDNPTCEYLGYEYGTKWESPTEGYYTVDRDGIEASLRVGTYADVEVPNSNNAVLGYSISTSADGYAVVVKGGDGANVYRSGNLVTPMHAPAVASGKWPTISHLDLCWNGPASPGELEVTKVVVGTDTADDDTFEICVTPVDTDGDPVCKEVVGNGTLTFDSLPPGEYVVTETDPGPRFSVEGSGVTVTVESEETTPITVTNTWIPPNEEFGQIEVTKVVTGEGAPADAEFTICIQGPTPATATICESFRAAETVTFDDLVPGTYTVTETDPGATYTVTITPSEPVEVTAGELPTKVIVTNAYEAPPTPPPEEEVVPPTQEALPPTAPITPTAPTAPATPAAPTAPAQVSAQALPTTGSEGGLAAIAAILVIAGVGLTLLGKRRGTQQA